MNRTFLIIAPERWSDHPVSKHHYARALAAVGYTVYFLEPPSPGLGCIKVTAVPEHSNLFVVSGPRVAKGLQYMPAWLRTRLEHRWLQRLEQQVGQRIDVVWLFENSRFYDLRFADDRLKLYYRADLFENFHPETAAATCDVMFSISDHMTAHGRACGAKAHTLTHGYVPQPAQVPLVPELSSRFSASGSNVVLMGNLDIYELNVEVIVASVRANPQATFQFVGGYQPDGKLHGRLKGDPNVVWWGKVPHTQLYPLLERADALMVCYLSKEYPEQVANPHKMMEYLASGKVVVATRMVEYERHAELLVMTDDYAAYPRLLSEVLADLPTWNAPGRVAARQAFAAQHTYEKQLARIFDIIRAEGFGAFLD